MKRTLLFLTLTAIIAGCGTSVNLFQPTEADVQKANQQGKKTDMATLDQGYQLFSKNCSGCHALPAPPKHSLEQWSRILPKMFPKTKMSEQECNLVQGYIEARR